MELLMKRVSKTKTGNPHREFDSTVAEILCAAVLHKAETVRMFQLEKEIKVELRLKKGRKKIYAKFPVATHKGLIDRIKYLADIPLRKTKAIRRSMIQVHLPLPRGEKWFIRIERT
jgi:hypothetical protein